MVKLNETLQMSSVKFPCSWDSYQDPLVWEEQEIEIAGIKLMSGKNNGDWRGCFGAGIGPGHMLYNAVVSLPLY